MPFQLCRLWVGYWHSVGSLVQILNRIWTKCKIQTNFRLLWTRGLLKDEVWNSKIIMVWLSEEFGIVLEAAWWHLSVVGFVSRYLSSQYYSTRLVLQYFDFCKCPSFQQNLGCPRRLPQAFVTVDKRRWGRLERDSIQEWEHQSWL